MNILQIVSSFAPAYAYGGPARSSHQISKNLSEMGHDVTVYTTDAYNANARYDPDDHGIPEGNLEIFRFKNISNTLAYEYNICLAPQMAVSLRRNINSFDVVHIEEFRTPQAVLAHHYATKYDVPYILQTRGGVPRTLKSKQKWVFDQLAGKRLFKDAARIIATSESESKYYFDVFPNTDHNKVRHVQNGVDLTTYADLPKVGKFRTTETIEPDVPVVLFVGRLDDMKGLDLLIQGFSLVRDAIPDAELFIIGPDDGMQTELEKQVVTRGLEDAVHFVGPLYDNRKLQAYVDADLFVLPSKYRYESFGNVVIEAMACETAVVLTKKCGAAEWIPSEAGKTVPATPDGIGAGIIELLSDAEKRESMAKNGRELVFQQFNWRAVSDTIEKIYFEVADER